MSKLSTDITKDIEERLKIKQEIEDLTLIIISKFFGCFGQGLCDLVTKNGRPSFIISGTYLKELLDHGIGEYIDIFKSTDCRPGQAVVVWSESITTTLEITAN